MYTDREFKGKTDLTRKGILNKVHIPENLLDSVGMDFTLNKETGTIEFCAGDEIFVLTEQFGISEECEFSVILVNGGFLINIVQGKVYINDSMNSTIYSVDECGDVDYPRADTKIHWVTVKDFLVYATRMVKVKYGTPTDKVTAEYVSNLAFGVVAEYSRMGVVKGSPCFKIQFVTYYIDLGVDSFVFYNYNDNEYSEEPTEEISYNDLVLDEEPESYIDDSDEFEDCVSLDDLEDSFEEDDDIDYEE